MDNIKLIAIVILALLTSFLSNALSEPPPSSNELKYRSEFSEASRKMLTEKEFDELVKRSEEFLDDVNSAESNRSTLIHIVKIKLVIVPLVLILWFVIGLKLGFTDWRYVVASSIALVMSQLVFVSVIEALVCVAVFAAGNAIFLRRLCSKSNA